MQSKPQRETAIISLEDPSYIVASSAPADDRTRVLKHGETFAVFDHYGDVLPVGLGEHGIYHEGTRHVSKLIFRLGADRPFLLGSSIKDNNLVLTVDLTNPDIFSSGKIIVPRGTLHFFRAKLLREGVCYERIRISNFGLVRMEVTFSVEIDADFADIFEVRGLKREKRGERLPDLVEKSSIILSYKGLDGLLRRTTVQSAPPPTDVSGRKIRYEKTIKPNSDASFLLVISFDSTLRKASLIFDNAYRAAEAESRRNAENICSITTPNHRFGDWLSRSFVDLEMMMTRTPEGLYPYAGVPWFSTVFGRDGIITALEFLWVNPEIAKGVLAYLAKNQATDTVPEQDAEPGKILHETRKGEMAATKEIPFGRYYGSVDSTPLFILLAGAYYKRTADSKFIKQIWGNIERALFWIDHFGDRDGDGFVEYDRQSIDGLIQQGWKDSVDSVFHADGSLAKPPIALCEVQGYVYTAKRSAAKLARVLGLAEKAVALEKQAAELKQKFIRSFWLEDLGIYALALDGEKNPCRVRTSNAGQTLFTQISHHKHAHRVARSLLSEDFFTGWGIRTVAATEARYNPMSYHNGSVWPHDNALIAYGCAKYGYKDEVLKILRGLFDVSYFMEHHRLPELFCGFHRRPNEGPTQYPVACAPQAWAAAAVFMLLQSALGLSIDAPNNEIHFHHPLLPGFLQEVRIQNLRVGTSAVDLSLERHEHTVGVNLLHRKGNVRLIATT